MDTLALIVAALGGGIVATSLNEWLCGRREYDEARLLVLAELTTMYNAAQAVVNGYFSAEWVAPTLPTAAWETYQVRLVRRLSKNMAAWGALTGVYTSVDLLRVNPASGDIGGLQRSAEARRYEPLRRIEKLGVTGSSRADLSVCTSNAARR